MRPRVVLIHNFLAPFRVPLFKALAERFELEVWILGDVRVIREWDPKPEDMPFPCKRLPGPTIGFGSRYNAVMLNYTLPIELARSNADAVICCGWDSPAAFYCGLWARFSKRPFILWSGSTAAEGSQLRRLTTPMVRWLVRSADHWLAYGTRSSEYLASLGAARERITAAFNAVDNDFYATHSAIDEEEKSALREQLGIGKGPVLLYVGNLIALKGVFELLEAFAKFSKTCTDVSLVLIGGGEDVDAMRQRADDLEVSESVKIIGFSSAETIALHYAIADLFVLSSRQEIWGLVINESLASGVPVLATDVCGATADLIEDGINGYIVPSRDPEALANAMTRHFSAPDQHQSMRDAARQRVAPVTYAAAADSFERAVSAALGKS